MGIPTWGGHKRYLSRGGQGIGNSFSGGRGEAEPESDWNREGKCAVGKVGLRVSNEAEIFTASKEGLLDGSTVLCHLENGCRGRLDVTCISCRIGSF